MADLIATRGRGGPGHYLAIMGRMLGGAAYVRTFGAVPGATQIQDRMPGASSITPRDPGATQIVVR